MVTRVLDHVRRVARFIKDHNAHIVHANSLKSDVIAGLAARLAGRPCIWHVRDRIARDYLPAPVVVAFRLLARLVPSFVIANSNATLRTLCIRRRNRTAAIPSGVAANGYHRTVHDGTHPDPASTHEAPADPTRPLVGLVGRISPWKGQHVFLRAAAEVRKHVPGARFQIIGSALFAEQDYEREVRALATQLALDDVVEFTGFRTDVPDLIARLDLLVHASTSGEPFGQVVVEGMAAGKAVVATRGGGVPEIVADGETGLLVPMADAPAMAAAILRLLGDPPLRERMGQAGRRRVRDHFSLQRTTHNVQAIYDELMTPRADRQII
jgi:glycosyltransferase involved in cell wall biosynthesis